VGIWTHSTASIISALPISRKSTIYIYIHTALFKKNQLENSQDYCCRKSWREAASVAFVEVGNL
jgi:hypothetical protein